MNPQKVQFILSAYFSSGRDADDPQFQEALAYIKNDPNLSKWFEEELALDRAISVKIKQSRVPAGLKENILAGHKMIRPKAWWQTKYWMAAAASFLVLLGGLSFWLNEKSSDRFTSYRHDMSAFLTRLDHLDINTPDVTKIKTWLGERNAYGDFTLPDGLKDLSGLGCRVLDWHGQKVTLVCFKTDGPKVVHLFITDRGGFPSTSEGKLRFVQDGVWTTASWSDGNKTYLLASIGDASLLRKYL